MLKISCPKTSIGPACRSRAFTYGRIQSAFRTTIRNEHLLLLVALASCRRLLIRRWQSSRSREAIDAIEIFWFAVTTRHAGALRNRRSAAWRLVLAPITRWTWLSALITWKFMPGGRNQGVADVVEASAMRGRAHVIAGRPCLSHHQRDICRLRRIGRPRRPRRTFGRIPRRIGSRGADYIYHARWRARLLGCGVAAAVSASFNAPIAGALFATEVVVGQYALKDLRPCRCRQRRRHGAIAHPFRRSLRVPCWATTTSTSFLGVPRIRRP